MKQFRPFPRHKKAKPVGELVAPQIAAAAVSFALSADTAAERKARLTQAYERKQITGPMLQELLAMHGLQGA